MRVFVTTFALAGDLDYARSLIGELAVLFGLADWASIASAGKRGRMPGGVPSAAFPWAGQVVLRCGWGEIDHWAFFDAGPWGTAHQHDDRLHLSLSAHGRDLLVDSGRYVYKPDPYRDYVRSSAGHNVILVDGRGRGPQRTEAAEPWTGYALEPDFDFAIGAFDEGFAGLDGSARHLRAVAYLRGRYWVVMDHVETDRPRTLTALWHFHPACSLAPRGGGVASTDAGVGNLGVLPVGDLAWELEIVAGQGPVGSPGEKAPPAVQGWYSRTYNEKEPAPTAVFSAPVPGSVTLVWVLVPAAGEVSEISVESLEAPAGAVRVVVRQPGAAPDRIAIRVTGEGAVPLAEDLILHGAFAWRRDGEPPRVAGGVLRDARGRTVAEHRWPQPTKEGALP